MEFDSYLADNLQKTHKNIPKLLQDAFKRYGITPEDWELLRTTPTLEHSGKKIE